MKFPSVFRHIHPVWLAAAGLALAAAAATVGCTGSCASNCPMGYFQVVASPMDNLNPTGAEWVGDACPLDPPNCISNADYTCYGFAIYPRQPGTCDLTITFVDRPTMTFHAEFGAQQTGCCRGFPFIGENPTVVLPYVGYDAGTTDDGAADAGTDAAAEAAATPADDAAAEAAAPPADAAPDAPDAGTD
jgi:hypothetical protein